MSHARKKSTAGAGPQSPTQAPDDGAFLTQQGQVDVDDLAALLKHDTNNDDMLHKLSRVPMSSQSTQLLQKKKKMSEVQSQLDASKDEFERSMRICDERQQQLKLKRSQIQERVQNFEKYVLENDSKRKRAERKAADEIKNQEAKTQEIMALTKQLEELKLQKAITQTQLDHKARYRQFLENTVDQHTAQFAEIADIISRYDTLKSTNENLHEDVVALLNMIEAKKEEFNEYRQKSQYDILAFNNEIAIEQKKLEDLKERNLKKENDNYTAVTNAMTAIRDLGEIRMSIYNIYSRCGIKHPLEDSDENKKMLMIIDAIGQRVVDLESIVDAYEGPTLKEGSVDRDRITPVGPGGAKKMVK